MPTIQLAAQRSASTGEAVWFAWKMPRLSTLLTGSMLWLLAACALLSAGQYAHIYWQCRHPEIQTAAHKAAKPQAVLSDMHYVYVTKAFPHAAAPAPVPAPEAIPMSADDPVTDDISSADTSSGNGDDNDWTHAPDGSLATRQLPGNDTATTPSLKERLMEALKEQQQDYKPDEENAPAPDTEPQKTPAQAYPPLADQPARIQTRIPAMQYQAHDYTSVPGASHVVLNGKTYRPGDTLSPGVTIKTLMPQSLVVEIDGQDFTLPALVNWEPE